MVIESATPVVQSSASVPAAETLEMIESKRNHPLHLHPSDTPGSVLTTVQLTGSENYSLWSRSMIINLRAKSKLGFVLGTCRKSDYTPELEEQWEKCNAFVLAWMMNTVSKELLSGIVYASDAAMVWEDLKERFDKVDGSRVYQLHRDICTIHQGNLTVSAYFTKLRLLWDEFDALVPPPSCNCDRSRIYVDHMHYLRLFAFLMGLSEIYGPARSQILMMNPLPTVGKAYAMIVSDENQRITSGLRNGGDVIEATTLYANRSGYGYRNTDRGDGDKGEYNRSGYGYRNTGRGDGDKGYNSKKKVNWNLFCEHCKLHGHTKNICYKLVGYPEDWKFKKKSDTGMTVNKGKGIANNVQVDRNGEEDVFGVVNEGDKNEQGSHDLNSVRTNLQALAMKSTYTPDQYRKIMKLLNEEKQAEVNMAGPLQWRGEGDW
ncbi:uncharacterized protein LOC114078089 [Solanum pennellii]|uniref:Uncharacterized protein LOC114078089 n=2 Tax=Solanum pennellii TaxID=28526 RepID=A0ABM1VFK6_SOLPN|nr:uncharacterized protein LOC114078089 [Solanum pennellii]